LSVSPTPSRTVPPASEPFEPIESSEPELSELAELSELLLELSELLLELSGLVVEGLVVELFVVVVDCLESARADPDFPVPAAIMIVAARSTKRTGTITA
jgi:hypothetical protein